MAAITLEEVGKRFPDGTVAVDRFSLDIADGEFVVLVGPSGCGKSTLLNMVAGLEEVTAGTIAIDGRVVNELPPRDRNIAMVFQSYALYPHMTVRGNLAFPLELAGLDAATIRSRVEEVAAMLDLTPHLDRKPAHLSGGQRQRVAMGRAIVRRPHAFLMDEPLSNLDALLRVQMRRQVAAVQRTLGTTTLYVTHDQTEAMTLGDRVVVLRRGVVQQVGEPQALYRSPDNLFVAGFIGSPSMNFVPATIEDGVLRGPLGELPVADLLRDRSPAGAALPGETILGIRPEHLRLARDTGDPDARRVRVEVTAIESLGSDAYAWVTPLLDPERAARFDAILERVRDAGIGLAEAAPGAGGPLIARLDDAAGVKRGETIDLTYDPRHVHVFDTASGTRLT